MSITSFLGGATGIGRVTGMAAVQGAGLAPVEGVTLSDEPGSDEPRSDDPEQATAPCAWRLRGFGSNHRYASRAELDVLGATQAGLGRAEATCAALIPIRKSEAWWRMAQDERLALFGIRSGHNRIGLDYLPGVARRLLHCRDLGEPFDFLTWFEFAPADAPTFDELLRRLRATEEWSYVEREAEVRLRRSPG